MIGLIFGDTSFPKEILKKIKKRKTKYLIIDLTKSKLFKKDKNYIIIDFGTATTFDVVKSNNYIGGVIAPGVQTSLNNLSSKASLIPNIKLKKIKKGFLFILSSSQRMML